MSRLITHNATRNIPVLSASKAFYRIDDKASLFTVRAFADGLISAAAHNPQFTIRQFTGDVQMGLIGSEKNEVSFRIKAGGFELMDGIMDEERRAIEHVMNHEVLEVEYYPEISYLSSNVETRQICDGVYVADITGHLVLHGVTRKLSITAQVVTSEDTLRATGGFTIQQTDYGIKIASVAGGVVKVQDQLRFCFYILARRAA